MLEILLSQNGLIVLVYFIYIIRMFIPYICNKNKNVYTVCVYIYIYIHGINILILSVLYLKRINLNTVIFEKFSLRHSSGIKFEYY